MDPQEVRPPKVLIVHAGGGSHFPDRERETLSSRYRAETFGYSNLHELPRLRRKMNDTDVVIFWFIGRAAICGMFPPPKKPKIISLVGGYEAAASTELDYGSALSFWKRPILRYILKRSHRIVAVSDYTRHELIDNYGVALTDVTVIHNAIDTAIFIPRPAVQAKDLVFTVASIDRIRIRIKGVDVLVETAKRLPGVRFVVAGGLLDSDAVRLARRAPQNVEFVGELSQRELRARYQSAALYFQPSRHESFGVSVIEAMSCGCVPVVSPCGALPEVVGDAGYVFDRLEPDHAAEVLQNALRAPLQARDRARARVVTHFDIRHRAEKMYTLIDELLEERGS